MIKFLVPFIFLPLLLLTPLNWYILLILFSVLFRFFSCFCFSHTLSFSFISPLFLLDSLSWPLIILTLWISILRILASQTIWQKKISPLLFLSFSSLLLFFLILCFLRNNLLLFYLFFEASLIPTLLLIILWGYQPERLQAGTYLMLYTITASLPFLLAILLLFYSNGHLSLTALMNTPNFRKSLSFLWSFQLSAAFLVKLPMYSTHLWLPKAHVEAPVAGSMLLAGILLKLGAYGLLRTASIFPNIIITLLPLILPISVAGAAITRFICLRQSDFKSLIAYSSVGHMGLLAGGLLSGFTWGWQGALLMRLAHGLCSSGLFALANIIYLATTTRSLFLIKGFQSCFPIISLWWLLFCITNMAAPPSLNLLREIILITRVLASTNAALPPIILLTFLSAAYSLFLFTSLQHGAPRKQTRPLLTLNPSNYLLLLAHLAPLVLLILTPGLSANWLF